MKLDEIYQIAIDKGRQADPRGPEGVARALERAQKALADLPERRRWEFDQESLRNPYADTRIMVGDPEADIGSMLVAIDAGVGEILLADRLRERGRSVDAVFVHHPEGRALADLGDVMLLQADVWRRQGVSVSFGDAIMGERIAEVQRAFHPVNTEQTIAAARLLEIPFLCCHTPADNNVQTFVQAKADELGQDGTVAELLDVLKEIPEYRAAVGHGTGPIIYEGDADTRTGTIMVDMTGGTSGPVGALERLAQAGVGTILGMHVPDEHRKKAKELHLNVVIAGHMASDSLGMNLIIDEYERSGVQIIPAGGFIRVSRV